MAWVFAFALASTGTKRVATVGRVVRLAGQNFGDIQYWPFSKLQPPLSFAHRFHCLPSTVHLPSVAILDEDAWVDELLELDGTLEAGATLDAGLDAAGVDEPPPPPPQAANSKVITRQVVPIATLV